MKNNFVPFNEIALQQEFKYQGRLFLKTAESRGVTQEQTIKHRTYYEFDLQCPVVRLDPEN